MNHGTMCFLQIKKLERVETAMKLGRKLELLNENDKYVFNCYLIYVVDLCIA